MIAIGLISTALLFIVSATIAIWYEYANPVPQSYRMNQRYYNQLRGSRRIKDANGNIYTEINGNKYYVEE